MILENTCVESVTVCRRLAERLGHLANEVFNFLSLERGMSLAPFATFCKGFVILSVVFVLQNWEVVAAGTQCVSSAERKA